jgi:hypothetical protein
MSEATCGSAVGVENPSYRRAGSHAVPGSAVAFAFAVAEFIRRRKNELSLPVVRRAHKIGVKRLEYLILG